MKNFELIDNLFQVLLLFCLALSSGIFALRHKNRSLMVLALAYACFAMGTTYYVLYLVIIGIWPQVFYVAEISWLSAWLFYLSAQILRTEGVKHRFYIPAAAVAAIIAVVAFADQVFGPSYFISALFSLTAGATVYFSISNMKYSTVHNGMDILMICCVVLQLLVYLVSDFTQDYTHFNLYFAVDIIFDLSMVALLPLTLREVKRN